MNLTVQELLSIEHVHESGVRELGLSHTFRTVSTDSRSLKPGDLFIALRGERFDGHDYISQVAKEGAAAAIVDTKWYEAHKSQRHLVPFVAVKNTLNALGELGRTYRRKFSIPVLVIAGSNGKTTTKELIAHVLSASFDVLKTEANYNNQIGLPHTLFQLREGHEMAVLEIGTNHPGELAWLCNVAEPTHALITNIGHEHLEFFKDLKGVAREEKAAFDYVLRRGGHAFINMDDPFLKDSMKDFGEKGIAYGSHGKTGVIVKKLGFSKDGRLELTASMEGKKFPLRTRLIANYAPNMIAAALAVGAHFGMKRSESKAQMESFQPHSNRLEISRWNGITILNDAYNANPDSMRSALQTLKEFPVEGRRFAILGDMFELGDTSEREHRSLGRSAAEVKLSHVFYTGKYSKLAQKAAQAASITKGKHSYFENKEELADALRDMLQPGDAVLVKGSRGMKMEEVIDLLQRG